MKKLFILRFFAFTPPAECFCRDKIHDRHHQHAFKLWLTVDEFRTINKVFWDFSWMSWQLVASWKLWSIIGWPFFCWQKSFSLIKFPLNCCDNKEKRRFFFSSFGNDLFFNPLKHTGISLSRVNFKREIYFFTPISRLSFIVLLLWPRTLITSHQTEELLTPAICLFKTLWMLKIASTNNGRNIFDIINQSCTHF